MNRPYGRWPRFRLSFPLQIIKIPSRCQRNYRVFPGREIIRLLELMPPSGYFAKHDCRGDPAGRPYKSSKFRSSENPARTGVCPPYFKSRNNLSNSGEWSRIPRPAARSRSTSSEERWKDVGRFL